MCYRAGDSRTVAAEGPRGFTLVEILIVVVILGILAVIAVPRLSNASHIARESTLKEDVRFLRTQIMVFQSQHRDVYPGYPNCDKTATPTADIWLQQMTWSSDEFGKLSQQPAAGYPFGPYLMRMPENPLNNGLTTVKVLGPTDAMTPDNSTGWLYQPSTGAIEPNLTGTDSDGKAYSTY